MTQTTKRILALLMAIAMLFAVAGCGGDKTDNNSSATDKTTSSAEDANTDVEDLSGISDDDFFSDDVQNIENGNGNQNGQSPNTSTATPTNKPTAAQTANYWKEMSKKMPNFNGKKIQVYNWNAMEEYPGLSSVIKAFQKATGISVQWVREDYNSYLQKLTSLIAVDKAPDIIRTNGPEPQVWALSQDISVSKYDDYKNEIWDQAFMAANTVNGKAYALNTRSSIMLGSQLIFYNRSLITKYNLDDPYKLWKNDKWTVDAFEKVLRDYKKATGNAAIGGDMIEKYLRNIYGLRGEIEFDTKQQKFVSTIDDSRVITTMQRAADIINKENLTVAWGLDEFDRGEILMFCGSIVTARRTNSYATTVKAAGNLGTVPWPTESGKKEETIFVWGDEGFAIPKGAKNPEIFPYYVFYVTDTSRYDMATFFPDNQALEVYDFLTDLPGKNRISGLGFNDNMCKFVGTYTTIKEAYAGKTGDQIPSALNANQGKSQTRADQYNEVLKKVGK